MSDLFDREFGGERLWRQIRFLVEMDRLKSVVRRTYVIGAGRYENSAEHSWQLALAAMILAEHADEPVDLPHVLQMLLVHDIIEIDAGDTYAYDPLAALDKLERETQAAERIFGLLPPDQAMAVRVLWDEFESGLTPEARFANAVDRIMPLLHNYYTAGRSWQEHGVSHAQVVERKRRIGDASASLAALAREVVDNAVARGYLPPPREENR